MNMKKILLVLTLGIMLLATPAVADAPIYILVDGKSISTPGLLINDTTYVPLRVISESLGAKVEWVHGSKNGVCVSTKLKALNRPPIKGDKEFNAKINAALDLLEQKDFPHYWMVCMNTADIAAISKPPHGDFDNALAFHFGSSTRVLPLLTDDPKRYVPTYLAGVLVHEAIHAVDSNYRQEVSNRDSYPHELATYILLDAPQWMRDECIGRENE